MTSCPICKTKEAKQTFRPFCSKRCADIDLAKWLNNSYAIAETSTDQDYEQASPDDVRQAPYHETNKNTS